MRYYGVDSEGKFKVPRSDSLPTGTGADDEGRLNYTRNNQKLYLHDSTAWVQVGYGAGGSSGTSGSSGSSGTSGTAGYADIPVDTEILIRSNVAIFGYSIVTAIDDELVYITKGSGAGGEAGATSKTGSTWTQPNHTHTTGDHTLTISEIPSHRHYLWDGCTSEPYDSCSGGTPVSADEKESGSVYTDYAGGGSSHNHGATGGSATTNNWRPKGHNFTIQKRV